MARPDIRHRLGIDAPAPRVYDAVASTDGLAGWWAERVEGNPALGGTLNFFFGGVEPRVVMEVTQLVPERRVAWRCVGGPDEWVGTTLTFDLRQGDEETVILFTHAEWAEPVEFLHHRSTKWAYFLLGLKDWLEGGLSSAYPKDRLISGWG